MRIAATFTTIEWRDGAVVMIDQRLLPGEERYNVYRDVAGVAEAIRTMVIRGAPAIGVAAAYGVALAARAGDVPFYVAAPWSTIDMDTPDGTAIPIEERPPEDVTHVLGTRIVPEGVPVRNPAFDVTPAHLVTAIIADRGIVRPPYDVNLAGLA